MKEHRPDPEKLLQRIEKEEAQEKHGKLKIYLGAAPGVGKTHTMLEDALDKRMQGLDIVIGIVETHGRREIEFLLDDIEIIPKQSIQYRGQPLEELDLEAILKRNPAIVLIDEMAHTNIAGVRHTKRWQDIKEILDRGIDVYTTLNVQHIESLNDVVSQIIHTHVKETVPDFMLELATSIELVDLPPEDLLKRLQDGKVYFPAQAEIAKDHFFLKGNLTALRELALRFTAERVSKQVLSYRQEQGIKYIWPTKEKLLVCVSHEASSNKLLRVAKRLATRLGAEWIAVHVETPQRRLSEEERNNIVNNLRLAEKLGAETRTLNGSNIVNEIMAFAHEQNITEIVIWKQIKPRWKEFFLHSLADEIVRNSHEIDVYVVTSERTDYQRRIKKIKTPAFSIKIYLFTLGLVGLATIISTLLFPYLKSSVLFMIYLLAVTIVATFGQIIPSILASVLSVLAYYFFFIPPYHQLAVVTYQYFFTFIVMLIITLVISNLTILNRRQVEIARLREKYTASLHNLSLALASTRGVDKLLKTAVSYIADVFNSEVMALMPENNQLIIRAKHGLESNLNEKEQNIAAWVYDLGQTAGLGTDTLPFSNAIYIPLLALQGCIGVLRVQPLKTKELFSPEQMRLLTACTNQIALAIEVDRINEQTKQSKFQSETERKNNQLLQSVSHSLRTPLATVMVAANTLMEMSDELSRHKTKTLVNEIYVELEQLNRLINNLLQITYLDAKSIKLQKQFYSLTDVIYLALQKEQTKLGKRSVYTQIPSNLPLVPFDETLIQEVLINLIDNAIQFTPPDTPIEIHVSTDINKVIISIEDGGPGIVPDEVNKLFEKFYRGRMLTTKRGLGLGLAICRSIVNAHGGTIWAENRKEGGAAFHFTLSLT